MKKKLIFHLSVFIFIIIISIPLLIPYLKSGFFPTHDGEWAVVRLADMFRELRDLQIPARYSGNLNFSYGYPLFNFAYPFPYYVGVLIHGVGFGFVNSIKVIFAMSILLSSYLMFYTSRLIWKNDYAGIISSILYLYFPYRLVDLYVRGSIGESVAFVLFPLILFCIYKSFWSNKSIFYLIIGAASYAILITSHNIMAVFFSMTIFFFFIYHFIAIRKDVIRNYLFIVVFGVLLSAFFWIPALFEKSNILLSVIPIADRSQFFVSFKESLISSWGYGIPTDKENGFTYQIGFSFLIVIFSSLGFLIYNKVKKNKLGREDLLAIVLLISIGLFTFMLFRISGPFWKLPILSEINFPWTTLSQIGFLSSILVGFIVKNKYTKYLAVLLAIIALVLYLPLAKPSEYVDRGEGFYFTNDGTTTSSNELMPLWVKSQPVKRPDEKIEIIRGSANIEDLVHNSKIVKFSVIANEDSIIRINIIYYPGWKVKTNENIVPVDYLNEFGVMDINLPAGKHIVEASFSETRLRFFADIISAFALIALISIAVVSVLKIKK